MGGSAFSTEFQAVDHLERMLSLDNAFSEEDMRAWATRVEREAGGRRHTTSSVNSRSMVSP